MTVMGLDNARTYYGEVLTSSLDLRTDACATAEAPAHPAIKDFLVVQVHFLTVGGTQVVVEVQQ